jgi:hypothetical protein
VHAGREERRGGLKYNNSGSLSADRRLNIDKYPLILVLGCRHRSSGSDPIREREQPNSRAFEQSGCIVQCFGLLFVYSHPLLEEPPPYKHNHEKRQAP